MVSSFLLSRIESGSRSETRGIHYGRESTLRAQTDDEIGIGRTRDGIRDFGEGKPILEGFGPRFVICKVLSDVRMVS